MASAHGIRGERVSGIDVKARKLDPSGGVALVIGSILGSGIFVAPSLIASFSTSFWIFALFWICGGIVCTAGALIYGGLGLRFPEGGGQYIFLKRTLGERYSNLYGWLSMLVIGPSMNAGTALFLAALCQGVWPQSQAFQKPLAVAFLFGFTFLNTTGLQISSGVQKTMVITQITLFLGVMLLSFFFLPNQEVGSYLGAPIIESQFSLKNAIVALAAVLWSFEGFNSVTFLTNEVVNGEKNVRRIALTGSLIVIGLYLIFNFVVLANIPASVLKSQTNAASYLMIQLFGSRAAWVVFVLTILGVANVLHSSITIGPRVIAATVRDRQKFLRLAEVNKNTGAPVFALWFQCVIALVYVLVGHFESLMVTFIVMNWLFYGLVAIGYLQIHKNAGRKKRELAIAFVFLSMVVTLLASQFFENPGLACVGMMVFALGVYGPWAPKGLNP
jgi:basic amino acid/polyamine antiporter, APA family